MASLVAMFEAADTADRLHGLREGCEFYVRPLTEEEYRVYARRAAELGKRDALRARSRRTRARGAPR